MKVNKYIEDFVSLSVDTFFIRKTYKDFFEKHNLQSMADCLPDDMYGTSDFIEFCKIKREAREAAIKILFRIECCEETYGKPPAQVITEIIDTTIHSNYIDYRPSDEQLADIIQNHNYN